MPPIPTDPRRALRKDAERNRRRILDAARELFAQRGLGVTLNDVAHHAGVGVGTVYRRFPDKAQLIDELFEERLAEVVALADAALEDPDPWNGLAGFLERVLELQAGDRALKELVLTPPSGVDRVARMRAEVFPRVQRLVGRARSAGRLRAGVHATDVPLLQLMIGTVIDLSRDAEPELWRRYLHLALEGLRAQPDPRRRLHPAAVDIERLPELLAAWKPPR